MDGAASASSQDSGSPRILPSQTPFSKHKWLQVQVADHAAWGWSAGLSSARPGLLPGGVLVSCLVSGFVALSQGWVLGRCETFPYGAMKTLCLRMGKDVRSLNPDLE